MRRSPEEIRKLAINVMVERGTRYCKEQSKRFLYGDLRVLVDDGSGLQQDLLDDWEEVRIEILRLCRKLAIFPKANQSLEAGQLTADLVAEIENALSTEDDPHDP